MNFVPREQFIKFTKWVSVRVFTRIVKAEKDPQGLSRIAQIYQRCLLVLECSLKYNLVLVGNFHQLLGMKSVVTSRVGIIYQGG